MNRARIPRNAASALIQAARWPAEARLLLRLLTAGLALFALARLVFVLWFADRLGGVDAATATRAFAVGALRDASFLAWFLLPVWALVFLPRVDWADRRWVRRAVCAWIGVIAFLLFVGVASDLAHYREFDIRLNGASLDYLRQPLHLLAVLYHEFALLPVVGLMALSAWLVSRRAGRVLLRLAPVRALGRRRVITGGALLAGLLLAGPGAVAVTAGDHAVVSSSGAHFRHSYVANQLASNGPQNFMAAWISELGELDSLSRRAEEMPGEQAVAVVRRELRLPRVADEPANPLWRHVDTGAPESRRNVVVILMESFSARGIGSLDGTYDDAPCFDRLAAKGQLFTRNFAVGTRTNRGLAGVLSSLPALPGPSPICTLDDGQRLFTVADVLAGRGYGSVALYGGERDYDNLDQYLAQAGFEKRLGLDDFASPQFLTEWGVSDEELFDKALVEFRELAQRDEPFLGFVLTLSNHRPYRVPGSRVAPPDPADPEGPMRQAFRYADWALGRFFEQAAGEEWFDDTLFVLVADHGRHLRSTDALDIESFRVPFLLYAPSWLPPARFDGVTSQVDVAPTVLGVLGGTYDGCFLGSDARTSPPDRAMLAIGDYVAWTDGRVLTMWPPEGPLETFRIAGGKRAVPLGERAGRGIRARASAAAARLRAHVRVTFDLTRDGRYRAPRPGTPAPLDATR